MKASRCGYKLLQAGQRDYVNRTFALSRKGLRQAEVAAAALSRQGHFVFVLRHCDPETVMTCLNGKCGGAK